MPSKIRTGIVSMLREDEAPPSMLSQMDVELGCTFASAVHIFTQRHGIAVDDIDLIGSGGQLVSLTARPTKGQHRANICLGEGAVISAKTGATTVSDYRTSEQAVGRQGGPLFASLVGLLLHHPTRLQICITVSDITTVCFVPSDADGGIDAMYDWDAGPGTVLIDAALRFYGIDPLSFPAEPSLQGGKVCRAIVDEVLEASEYLKARPPKTTAREIFDDDMAYQLISSCQALGLTPADTLATLAQLTTASIIGQLLRFGPSRDALNRADMVVDARDAYPPLIHAALACAFPQAALHTMPARTGLPAAAQTPVGFALQALECLLGRTLPVPTNADARRPNSITGKIAPGVAWRAVMGRAAAFGGCGRGWEGLPEVRELRVVRREKERERERDV
jgi:1,6-anhydro-N-acetylmuramate kinase